MSAIYRPITVTPWVVDETEVNRLLAEWGVKRPVVIYNRLMPCDCELCQRDPERAKADADELTSGTTGRHKFDKGYTTHEIQLNSTSTLEEANRTLLHELTHARQTDADPLGGDLEYRLFNSLVGYGANPYEYEARAVSEHLAPVVRLVKPALTS